MNIEKLIAELMEATKVETSTISSEARTLTDMMRKEFARLQSSTETDKQEKMITLFIGGTIMALNYDDKKYRAVYQPKLLYPGAAITTANLIIRIYTLEHFHAVGAAALNNLPADFSGDLFKRKVKLIGSDEEIPFFPELDKKAKKVDELVKFCISNRKDFKLADTSQSKSASVTAPVVTPSSSTVPSKVLFDIEDFKKRHRASRQGLFCGLFSKTNLAPYDNLDQDKILAHAKKGTFFGAKNRTRKILEDMNVLDKEESIIKKP